MSDCLLNLFVPGLVILNVLVTLFFVRPLSHDGMRDEDEKVSSEHAHSSLIIILSTFPQRQFRECIAAHGYDVGRMGLGSVAQADSFGEVPGDPGKEDGKAIE